MSPNTLLFYYTKAAAFSYFFLSLCVEINAEKVRLILQKQQKFHARASELVIKTTQNNCFA